MPAAEYGFNEALERKVRVFLDTKFADWDDPGTELISIALVAEDGREFYAERNDFDLDACTTFVRREVLPLLGAPSVPRYDRAGLKAAVLEWLRCVHNAEIAVDYDRDWHLLCRLLGADVPDGLTVTNIHRLLDERALEDYYRQHGVPKHHALYDARANWHAYP